MPHPFCTSTRIRLPPAGRPPLHRADARCTWALEYPSDRFRGVLRHEKKPEGYTSTPTGLKRLKTGLQRLKTQNTAFRVNENGKGTPSGVPQPIYKRKLILVKEEFDASSFGGGGGSRTPVRKLFHGNFSGRRRLLRRSCSSCSPLPRQAVTPEGQVSFIMHGRRKALPAHVHH